jgi:cation diffusion facilitator CzcD-associated flavoprotein CzcO
VLPALAPGSSVDVVVAGCGPAGLHLASILAQRGIKVGLVGELQLQGLWWVVVVSWNVLGVGECMGVLGWCVYRTQTPQFPKRWCACPPAAPPPAPHHSTLLILLVNVSLFLSACRPTLTLFFAAPRS